MKPVVRSTIQVLSLVALALMTIYLLPKNRNQFRYHYEIGQPWAYSLLVAESNFAIYKTPAELENDRAEIMKDYKPVYLLKDTTVTPDRYVVSYKEMLRLQEIGCYKISVINDKVVTPVALNDIYTPRMVFEATREEVLPNLEYDSISSEKIKAHLYSNVSLTHGAVKAGDKIIDANEIVSSRTYQILESMRRSAEESTLSHRQKPLSCVGFSVTIVMMLLIFGLYLVTYRKKLLDEVRHILFFTILMAVMIAIAFFVISYLPVEFVYVIPFAWVPIITRVFYDSRTAIFIHLITTLVVSVSVPSPYAFLLLQIVSGVIAVISLRDMTQRAQLAQTALYLLLTYSVIYTASTMFMTGSLNDVNLLYYIYFAINSVLVICSYGLIFLFERSFGLVSNITLVELTNVNSHLMLSFAEKAPGTFQHSLQVSNLATEAAKRIGAKVLLVRTGAMYHDIGKMVNPEYFTENQIDEHNPLLQKSHKEASRIVIDHIINGEKIARKNHLPEVIVHFIRSHHGTSTTRYFYNSALNAAKSSKEEVNVLDYSYPGPKPTTKEAGILMMADAIEACSRTLGVINPDTVSEMVDRIINMQISEGQFSETPLSFKDIEDVRAVFKQKLLEMNHHRISYPSVQE